MCCGEDAPWTFKSILAYQGYECMSALLFLDQQHERWEWRKVDSLSLFCFEQTTVSYSGTTRLLQLTAEESLRQV